MAKDLKRPLGEVAYMLVALELVSAYFCVLNAFKPDYDAFSKGLYGVGYPG